MLEMKKKLTKKIMTSDLDRNSNLIPKRDSSLMCTTSMLLALYCAHCSAAASHSSSNEFSVVGDVMK